MPRRRPRDGGAAAAEFVLVTMLLVLLLFGVLQVGVVFYARIVVAASAADAARYAASADMSPADGARRAEQMIGRTLGGDAFACSGSAGTDAGSGLPVSTVRCEGRPRALLANLSLPARIEVRSSALTERLP